MADSVPVIPDSVKHSLYAGVTPEEEEPMAKGQPAADVIELREDGTVRLAWDSFDVTLRRPKIREWRSYLEEGEAADAWTRGERVTDDGSKPRTVFDLLDGPYLALYQRVILELSGTEITEDDAATWMVDSDFMRRLSAHWRANPLTLGEAKLLLEMTPSR